MQKCKTIFEIADNALILKQTSTINNSKNKNFFVFFSVFAWVLTSRKKNDFRNAFYHCSPFCIQASFARGNKTYRNLKLHSRNCASFSIKNEYYEHLSFSRRSFSSRSSSSFRFRSSRTGVCSPKRFHRPYTKK